MDYQKLLKNKLDRRRLLGGIGVMGAGAVLAACNDPAVVDPLPDPDPDQNPDPDATPNLDAAILNFALNLEYLEAAFYLAAVDRLDELPGGDAEVRLPEGFTPLFSPQGPVMNSSPGLAAIEEYAQETAQDELNHVNFLRKALADAGAPVAERPVIDLDASFKAAAAVAFAGVNPGDVGLPDDFTPDAFDPFANEAFYLHGSFIFEDVGVTAYHGAAEYLTNKAYLRAAAGILAVEAYHAGTVRTVLYGTSDLRGNLFGGLDTWSIVNAISNARDSLDGDTDLDQGIVGNPNYPGELSGQGHEGEDGFGANIVPTDVNSITFPRTPRQVANIVYLAPDSAMGGFFPDGITVPAGLEEDFAALLAL